MRGGYPRIYLICIYMWIAREKAPSKTSYAFAELSPHPIHGGRWPVASTWVATDLSGVYHLYSIHTFIQ